MVWHHFLPYYYRQGHEEETTGQARLKTITVNPMDFYGVVSSEHPFLIQDDDGVLQKKSKRSPFAE